MKKNIIVTALVVAFSGIGFSYAPANDTPMPSAEGEDVYTYLTEVSPYQEWPLFPGTKKFQEGKHPHGALLTTYVSPSALSAIQERQGQLPIGAFIVKENYMPDQKLGAITIMYRVKGYNPAAGDWFWAKYSANGDIAASGKVDGCINCHTAAIQNDWVFTGPLK